MPGDGFYRSKAWRDLRIQALKRDRFRCQMCSVKIARRGEASVDHIKRRKDAPHLALELSNTQSLCNHCHNSHKQRHESQDASTSVTSTGTNLDGTPINGRGPWGSGDG